MADTDTDDSQKTEQPTSRRLEKGRQRGQVAVSQEVKSWAVLTAGALGVLFLAPSLAHDIATFGRVFIEQPHALRVDADSVQTALMGLMLVVGRIVAPLIALIMVAALGVSLVQSGLLWAPAKIKPEFSKVSPLKGIKRLFSMRTLVEFGKGILKLSAVSVVAFGLAIPLLGDAALLPNLSVAVTLDRLHAIAISLIAGTVGVLTVVAGLDYMFQRYSFMKDMRMTRQEVRDEHKQSEGDPQIKARIRKLRAERAQRRMMAAVPEADVVITNPTHYAVALKYEMAAMAAPKLVAKGVDSLALRIREVAGEHDVPIVENPPLARALYASVELDEDVPPQHYQAVAEVIGYVMRLKGRIPWT
ncbi:MAG: flagellar biosynthesis protein FlhB [Rhodospirillales bacterium]|nr:flagellar biosynthesis protein FlhB [Rhodospirillales bacterium]